MAIIRDKITLRKRRKDGDRLPNRVKLDNVGGKDILIIEIVIDTKNNKRCWYKFLPEQLAGRRVVTFTVSSGEVYWLAGANPQRIDEQDLPKDSLCELVAPANLKSEVERCSQIDSDWRKKPRKKKVMIFDAKQKLMSICTDLSVASDITHILPESIDKLCKSKKPSQETGLYFRYYWKKLDPSYNILDFSLTVAQYDECCKRVSKSRV